MLHDSNAHADKRFNTIESRFDSLETRFNSLESRSDSQFAALKELNKTVISGFESVEGRLEELGQEKLFAKEQNDRLTTRVTNLESDVEKNDVRLTDVEKKVA